MGSRTSKTRLSFTVTEIRIYAIELLLLLFACIIILRLLHVQLLERSKYQAMAERQYLIELPLEAQRGLIYDRNMNYLVLNEPCISVGLDKRQMEGTSSQYARVLAPLLGVSRTWLQNRIRSVKSPYVWLRRRLDVELGPKIGELNLPGIRVVSDSRRVYPHQEVASHIIGFTDPDNIGIAGVELEYNDVLKGQDGYMVIQRDGRGRKVPENVVERKDPVDGKNVVLTIDYILQTIATEELRNAVRQYDAQSGSVVILDPKTGEILALANEPGFNPNKAGAYSLDARRNRAITDAYEPGSTFKIVPFAALLEHRLKRLNELVNCEQGVYQFNGRRIRDTRPHGNLTLAEVLAYSSNIGTVKLARELGEERLYHMARKFGFGEKTHIELPGENRGILRPISKWTSFSLASIAIGQELSCNVIQLAMAYAAIANGGTLLKPRLIKKIETRDGRVEFRSEKEVIRQVISPQTADTLTSLLVQVVEQGTGRPAHIPGLRVAGKTGTAQVPKKNGKGYSDSEFVSSFVGYFPAEDPRYLILVKLKTGKAYQWGSSSAAPTFKRIAQKIRVYDRRLHITEEGGGESRGPDIAISVPQEVNGLRLPDLTTRHLGSARAILEAMGLKVRIEGKGDFVAQQDPPAGTPVQYGEQVTLTLFEVETADGYLKMPNLIGLSLREALNRLSVANIDPIIYGHGRVVRQKPEPGSLVRAGIRCILEFEPEELDIPILSKIGYEN